MLYMPFMSPTLDLFTSHSWLTDWLTSRLTDSILVKIHLHNFQFKELVLSSGHFLKWTLLSLTAGACYENAHTGGCAISKEMSSRLGSFVRRGDPNSHTTTHLWPRYSRQPGRMSIFITWTRLSTKRLSVFFILLLGDLVIVFQQTI